MTFETFDQSDEKTWSDQQKDNDDSDDNDDNEANDDNNSKFIMKRKEREQSYNNDNG